MKGPSPCPSFKLLRKIIEIRNWKFSINFFTFQIMYYCKMYKDIVFSRLLCCVDCIVMVLLVSVISVLTVLLGPHAQVRGCEGFEQLNDLTLGYQTSDSVSSSKDSTGI